MRTLSKPVSSLRICAAWTTGRTRLALARGLREEVRGAAAGPLAPAVGVVASARVVGVERLIAQPLAALPPQRPHRPDRRLERHAETLKRLEEDRVVAVAGHQRMPSFAFATH